MIDIVFCHSELAASIFLEAGARHVVSVPEDEIFVGNGLDQTIAQPNDCIMSFIQSFYARLWKKDVDVCSHFNAAKNDTALKFGTDSVEGIKIQSQHEASITCLSNTY